MIKKCLIINITELDKVAVWNYIADKKNWITHQKGSLIDIDKAEEFFLNDYKSINDFESFLNKNEMHEMYDIGVINMFRHIMLYIDHYDCNKKFDKVLIDYSW